jgi:hypothetical protein
MDNNGPGIMVSLDLSLANMLVVIRLHKTSEEHINKYEVIDKHKYMHHS